MPSDSDMIHRETCRSCGASLSPGHTGPCPSCGKEGKKMVLEMRETVQVREKMSGMLERRREFLEENPKVKWLLIAIALVGVFLGAFLGGMPGLLIGFVFAALTHFLGPHAVRKVIEIERRSF